MQAELEILRGNRSNAERLSSTLQEMESLLKRVEAEKAHSIESQLQSALLERDNLRQLVENLNEQHNQLVDGLKVNYFPIYFYKFNLKFKGQLDQRIFGTQPSPK